LKIPTPPLRPAALRLAQLLIVCAAVTLVGIAPARAGVGAKEIAEGRALYMRYCAACHGEHGRGHGPVARSLREQPSDLTRLSEKFGSPLPEAQIARYIDGRSYVAAHGRANMPVWGERFADIWVAKGSREGSMDQRIGKIVKFLDSIQAPSKPAQPLHSPIGSLR
jgi:mono/diheme cytochrome c family protein